MATSEDNAPSDKLSAGTNSCCLDIKPVSASNKFYETYGVKLTIIYFQLLLGLCYALYTIELNFSIYTNDCINMLQWN